MKQVNDKEFAAVTALPGPRRYDYFVKTVADRGEVWTVRGKDGFVMLAAADESPLMPVWPARRYAEAWAAAEGDDAEAHSIPLKKWLNTWLEGMKKDKIGVAVFPVPAGRGVVVTPDRVQEDVRAELERIE
jgi:hypothetical protein